MPTTSNVQVQSLSLDLHNFRTIAQPNELEATRALISISPDWFWALMNSLLDDGYLPTDNIIAIRNLAGDQTIVKEGNRRIASLKIIHGLTDSTQLGIPASIQTRISQLTPAWLADNNSVPCSVYDHGDADLVNKIITRAHGKNERAGRNPWPSVAKARYNRDIDGAPEYGLTLLEKYLNIGRNVNAQQKERWAGDYTISILDNALPRVTLRLGTANTADLVSQYPNIPNRDALENMLSSIGQKALSFDDIRNTSVDFAAQYGIPPLPATPNTTQSAGTTNSSNNSSGQTTSNNTTNANSSSSTSNTNNNSTTSNSASNSSSTTNSNATTTRQTGTVASASNTPKSVLNKMKLFRPQGNGREKIVDLKNEILRLNISKSPIAFCFLLRSLFEISAKVYCTEKNIPTTTCNRGNDRKLVDLLTDATNHLTQNGVNLPMVRQLTGALQQLTNVNSILSVTSMNQLVHNPNFSVLYADVCTMFHNIYPLLEHMN